jgi:glycosyltransferase involved in cell wall biosynthesis
MIDLIDGFQEAGILVDVLMPPGDYPAFAHWSQPPSRFQLLEQTNALARHQLDHYLHHHSPQVILSIRDRSSLCLLKLLRQRSTRPQLWLRIGSDLQAKLATKQFIARWRHQQLWRATYRAADGLIANSSGVLKSLQRLLGTPSPPQHCIPNPLNVSRIQQLALAPPEHAWFRDSQRPLIMGLGRLVGAKDFATLIHAFAVVRQTWPTARLVIFGEGRQRSALSQLINQLNLHQCIDLPGYVANPFVYLRRSDLFVLSSKQEGSPNVLLEALACQTPCVATDCRSGPDDILDHGRYGLLVPVGQASALAQAMLATLAQPLPADHFMAAVQRFQVASVIARYLTVLGYSR